MRKQKFLTISIILVMVLSVLAIPFGVQAYTNPTTINLFTVANFAALAATGVSSPTGGTVLNNGDLGINAGCTDFPFPCTTPGSKGTVVGGVIQNENGVATTGQTDATKVANAMLSPTANETIAAGHLDGLVLNQGVYDVPYAVTNLTGTLTLNGDANSIFIFRMASSLITAGTSKVVLQGGVTPCNVFWRVGSSATFDGTTNFLGTVIASTSVFFTGGGATLTGRVIAQTGAITFNNTKINRVNCPTITTALSTAKITAGGTVHDGATLSGTNISTATGTVTYNVYSNIACITSSLVKSSAAKPVTSGSADSGNIPFPSAGTFYWQAIYSGDSNNWTSTSPCDEVLTVASASAATSTPAGGVLPGTGFAPQHATLLSAQPAAQSYADLGDLWLEIPRLGVQMPIVGVPQANGQWDVSWLGNDAGWLNGTAFPTYSGNSVLAGHVYNADGTPGPFVHLNGLWWGDQVIVHAWGAQYVYEVRTVMQVSPFATSSVIMHKDLPWVTLVTCRGYDEASNSYEYRVAVGAVLVEVK